jgi:hypothetical protein
MVCVDRRHGVVVGRDPCSVERPRGRLSGNAFAGEVDQDHVVVGAAGDELEAALEERCGERFGVGDRAVGVVGELGCGGFGHSCRGSWISGPAMVG